LFKVFVCSNELYVASKRGVKLVSKAKRWRGRNIIFTVFDVTPSTSPTLPRNDVPILRIDAYDSATSVQAHLVVDHLSLVEAVGSARHLFHQRDDLALYLLDLIDFHPPLELFLRQYPETAHFYTQSTPRDRQLVYKTIRLVATSQERVVCSFFWLQQQEALVLECYEPVSSLSADYTWQLTDFEALFGSADVLATLQGWCMARSSTSART
jgi:hypothetical protein